MCGSGFKRFFATLLILIVCFSLLGAFYVNNITNLLTSETEMHLMEISRQGADLVSTKFDAGMQILRVISSGPIADPNISVEDKINQLKAGVSRNMFKRLGYADLNGNTLTTDGYKIYIGDRDYYINSVNGGESISEPLISKVDGSTVIVYSVPIWHGDKVISVLYASYDLSRLSEDINVSFFNSLGNSYIVDNEGKIIFSPHGDQLSDNIFKLIDNATSPTSIDKFRNYIKTNMAGTVQLSFEGVNKYIGFYPIRGVNNWNLVSTVPTDVIFQKSTSIIRSMLIALILLLIVFFVIILNMLLTKRKNDLAIYDLAFCDKLTKIGNHNKFTKDATKVLENKDGKNYAIIYFDIDNFKIINDTFGYAFGDKVLQYVANSLAENLDKRQIFARMSNDFFAILTPYNENQDVIKFVNMINSNLNNMMIENQSHIDIVLSIGIYLIKNVEADLKKALDKANMARSTIKGNQLRYAFFDEDVRNKLSAQKNIENDIKTALVQNQFEVYYQPMFDLTYKKIIGAEALIRWNHPTRGFLSPATFIPISEKSGLIIDIGRWVLDRVCSDISNWEKRGLNLLPISVNLSRVELYQSDLIGFISSVIHKYNISTNLLEIELTETSALSDLPLAISIINELKGIGLKVSMDDFGTGYSSLSCLSSIPINTLKLDKSFLADIETDIKSKNIAISVISLAKSLGLITVSEGVETVEQSEFLEQAGCDIVQGFYFGRPTPKSEYELLVSI